MARQCYLLQNNIKPITKWYTFHIKFSSHYKFYAQFNHDPLNITLSPANNRIKITINLQNIPHRIIKHGILFSHFPQFNFRHNQPMMCLELAKPKLLRRSVGRRAPSGIVSVGHCSFLRGYGCGVARHLTAYLPSSRPAAASPWPTAAAIARLTLPSFWIKDSSVDSSLVFLLFIPVWLIDVA